MQFAVVLVEQVSRRLGLTSQPVEGDARNLLQERLIDRQRRRIEIFPIELHFAFEQLLEDAFREHLFPLLAIRQLDVVVDGIHKHLVRSRSGLLKFLERLLRSEQVVLGRQSWLWDFEPRFRRCLHRDLVTLAHGCDNQLADRSRRRAFGQQSQQPDQVVVRFRFQ